ncbi:unnamed protein product, partial [Ectocarpus sp. 12 AP-2014]
SRFGLCCCCRPSKYICRRRRRRCCRGSVFVRWRMVGPWTPISPHPFRDFLRQAYDLLRFRCGIQKCAALVRGSGSLEDDLRLRTSGRPHALEPRVPLQPGQKSRRTRTRWTTNQTTP